MRLAVAFLLSLYAAAANADTPLLIYNQSDKPIIVWVGDTAGQYTERIRLRPNWSYTYNAADGQNIKVRVQYKSGARVVNREAFSIDPQTLASIAPASLCQGAVTVESKVTSEFEERGGKWEQTKAEPNECSWSLAKSDFGLNLALPQDSDWSGPQFNTLPKPIRRP